MPNYEERQRVPAGSSVWVHLDHPVSAAGGGSGDVVRGRTLSELRSAYGEVLIPRGSVMMGRVVGQARDRHGSGGGMQIVMEQIEMAGVVQRMRAEVTAVQVAGQPGDTARYSAGDLRGHLPAGSRVQVRLTRAIASHAAVSGQNYYY
jgi:hypothetical protein